MKSKKSKHKGKKLAVTLSERDVALLQRFAAANGLSKAVAMRRIVKRFLAEYASDNVVEEVAANQIGLFDSMQTDIFGNLTKLE